MSSPHAARLLADIGGTNARFAWQAGPGAPIEDIRTLPCASFPCIEAAIEAYLNQIDRPRPRIAAIAIANPVYGDEIRMTNHHWSFSIRELRRAMSWERLEVLNDFTALALALPTLSDSQRRLTGGGAPAPDSAIGLIGPGTGLGVSGLLPNGRGGWIPLQGEGGHATLAAVTPKERIVVRALQQRHQHVSAERAISGMGLEDIYAILCQTAHRQRNERMSAAQISQAALSGDALAKEALMMMCAFLGTVAGNLALTLGARGGVYIGGGIVPKLGAWFDQSPFRERFESKGRFRAYLKDIPVWVITADQSPALAGAAAQLDRLESFHRE
jgi:glucokinase